MNYESANGDVFADDDPGPLPQRARLGNGPHRLHRAADSSRRGAPSRGRLRSWSRADLYNAINFDCTYSDPPNTTVSFTPLAFLYCPSDPGSHIDDASLGGTGRRHDELRDLRRRLVRLVGQLDHAALYGRPAESLDVRAELCAEDRRWSPTG